MQLAQNGIHGGVGEDQRVGASIQNERIGNVFNGTDGFRGRDLNGVHQGGSRRPTAETSEQRPPTRTDIAAPALYELAE